MKNLNTALVLIIIIILLVLGNKYYSPDEVTINTTDTLKITEYVHTHDTVWPDTVTVYIPRDVNKIVYKFVNDSIRQYMDTVVNDDVKIMIKDDIKGSLVFRDVKYQLFVPKIIRDSVFVKSEETVYRNYNEERFVIGEVGFDLKDEKGYVGASYLIRKDRFIYGGGFDTRGVVKAQIGLKIK